MAKLNKTARDMVSDADSWIGQGPRKVGNNREMSVTQSGSIVGVLHGTIVFTYNKRNGHLIVTTGGYLTVTTVAAINDFLGVCGLPYKASRAGGEFALMQQGEVIATGDNEIMLEGVA